MNELAGAHLDTVLSQARARVWSPAFRRQITEFRPNRLKAGLQTRTVSRCTPSTFDKLVILDAINAQRYYTSVISSFACVETERVFRAELSRRFPPDIQRRARRKLLLLHAATELRQLTVPPGNRLEPLKGGRQGQHSIRVNDQWRICFRWRGGNAHDVEIADYH